MNTIDPEVKSLLSNYENAYLLWKNLNERFSVVNGPRIQQLKSDIARCEQSKNMPVSTYFGKLKICSTLLSRNPLPSLNRGFQHISQEERVRSITCVNDERPEVVGFVVLADARGKGRLEKIDKSGLMCSHCRKPGHDIANYFALLGYPEWCTEKYGGVCALNVAVDSVPSSREATMLPGFTSDQWQALVAMFGNPQPSSNHLNVTMDVISDYHNLSPMTEEAASSSVSTKSEHPNMGRGMREKFPSVNFPDFVTHTILKKSPSHISPMSRPSSEYEQNNATTSMNTRSFKEIQRRIKRKSRRPPQSPCKVDTVNRGSKNWFAKEAETTENIRTEEQAERNADRDPTENTPNEQEVVDKIKKVKFCRKAKNLTEIHKKVVIRNSPRLFSEMVFHLTDEQKTWVISSGFEELLKFDLEMIPSKLSSKIVQAFDHTSVSIAIENGRIYINEEDVFSVIGLPHGGKPIELKDTEVTSRRGQEWLAQFPDKQITVARVIERVRAEPRVTEMFKINFLIVLSNVLIGTPIYSYVDKQLVKFEDLDRCVSYNWAKFLIEYLVIGKESWNRKASEFFKGSQIFLTLFYVDRVMHKGITFVDRKYPSFGGWTEEKLKERKSIEVLTGEFGKGKILVPLKEYFSQDSQSQKSTSPNKNTNDEDFYGKEHAANEWNDWPQNNWEQHIQRNDDDQWRQRNDNDQWRRWPNIQKDDNSNVEQHGADADYDQRFVENEYVDNVNVEDTNYEKEDSEEETCKSLYYSYDVDSDGHLTKIFWTDAVGRRNFELYGDAVSFDATFDTNKYFMIFAPFTGVDKHDKCVTFAACLLSQESVTDYSWAFSHFLKAMGRNLVVIVTDQCAVMKVVILDTFVAVNGLVASNHRLCMWHIMDKFPMKLCNRLCKETDFMEKMKTYIWSSIIEIDEFEAGWIAIINEFKLEDNKWLSDMYAIRSCWIPAYFRNEPMFGLMRTTSRSESENFFFSQFHKQGDTLFDAANLFTRVIFYKLREEIMACCYDMQIKRMSEEVDGVTHFEISDVKVKNKLFKVSVSRNHAVCSCNKFVMCGIVCRHAFCVNKAGVQADRLDYVHKAVKQLNAELNNQSGDFTDFTKKDHMAAMLGPQPVGEVTILVPKNCKNKGNYFKKRLVSEREKALNKSKTRIRKCKKCEAVIHDARTCPLKKEENPKKKGKTEADGDDSRTCPEKKQERPQKK
ncbi:hypothetical protein POM88_000412 [Heracleum sosnowskyi]|uniref:SWIM-type domain-containing protein n=1 Tax=Heracleum sosnowskyi TaxID=360622 RepID=A0AAD8JAQ0_9APIA|nr:hypothetical protein POM88_000412 [Heracleum sosnowskyi]